MSINDLRDWLDVEILDANVIAAELQAAAAANDYGDWDTEVDRLNQQGFVMALEFVRRQI